MRSFTLVLMGLLAASISEASLVNGNFEIGTFSSWTVAGDTQVVNGPFAGYNPPSGSFHARIGCGFGTVFSGNSGGSLAETFLGLTANSLDSNGGDALNTGYSAIKQVVDLDAGDRIVFSWNFIPQSGTPATSVQDDNCFYTLHTTSTLGSVSTLASVIGQGGGNATGYRVATSAVIGVSGTYMLGFGILDRVDTSGGGGGVFNANLLVDNAFVLVAANVDVLGNGNIITNTDPTPSSADHTDFGSVIIAGTTSTSRTFTIANNGGVPIGVGNVSVSGPDFLNFSVTAQPASLVATGATTTFTVSFNPVHKGVRSATLTFTNTVPSRDPYSFAVQGFGEGYDVTVESAYGAPVPPLGSTEVSGGLVLTNFATASQIQGLTQFVAYGWTMVGNNPTSGTTNQFSTIFTNDATLTWLWSTNVWLDTESTPHGTVNVPDSWQPLNSVTALTAVADDYYHFVLWTDDAMPGDEANNPHVLVMDRTRLITANFTANVTTNTSTPQWWMAQFGITNNFEAAALADLDGDRIPTWMEYIADTDPSDSNSYFHAVSSLSPGTNFVDYVSTNDVPPFDVTTQRIYDVKGIILQWDGAEGRFYDVESSTSLGQPWTGAPGLSNIPAQLPVTVVTNVFNTSTNRDFLRVRVTLP